jgi:hypothetical protein
MMVDRVDAGGDEGGYRAERGRWTDAMGLLGESGMCVCVLCVRKCGRIKRTKSQESTTPTVNPEPPPPQLDIIKDS